MTARAVRSLDQIVADGFRLPDLEARQDHALSSLGLAIRAYVSTPHAIHGKLFLTEPGADEEEQRIRDYNLFTRYSDAAFETIVHLQHFAELVVKEALRQDHELLVVLAENHHAQLHDLLHGKPVNAADAEKLNAIEASVALSRACKLLEAGKLDPKYGFVKAHRPFLEKLNGLRNRLWHRGTLVLRYAALDELVGRFALPFVRAATSVEPYAKYAGVWRPKALHCKLDALAEIERELSGSSWSVPKVAFLKEMARAAHENPLTDSTFFADDNRRKRRMVEETVAKIGVSEVSAIDRTTVCPVCGMTALIVYEDGDDNGGEGPFVRYTWMAKCEGCTLELRASYGNASKYGWTDMEDYWWQDG